MTFPASVEDFRQLVAAMREVGAVQAFGVVLGPAPTKLEQLVAAVDKNDAPPVLRDELDAELRRARIAQARQEVRDMLGATGRDYTDSQIDRFLDPSVLDA